MKPKTRLHSVVSVLWIAFVLALLGLLLPYPLMARQAPEDPSPDSNRRYFEETEFWVSGEFLEYFDANGDWRSSGTRSRRHTMSGAFSCSTSRMHVWNGTPLTNPYKVQLGLLGDELGLRQPPVDRPSRAAGRVYFLRLATRSPTCIPAFLPLSRRNRPVWIPDQRDVCREPAGRPVLPAAEADLESADRADHCGEYRRYLRQRPPEHLPPASWSRSPTATTGRACLSYVWRSA